MMVKVVLEDDSIIDVGANYARELTFCKSANWRLWSVADGNQYTLLAGQFDHPKIVKLIFENVEIDLCRKRGA